MLLVHGDKDIQVDVDHSRRMGRASYDPFDEMKPDLAPIAAVR